MKQLRPISLVALAVLASCSTQISDPGDSFPASAVANASISKITGEESAKLVGGSFTPGVVTATNDTLTRPLPDDTVSVEPAQFGPAGAAAAAAGDDATCGAMCELAVVDACSHFGVEDESACGMGSTVLCGLVCLSSRLPLSKCVTHAGGKACMTRDRFWWCDTAVDGNKVRARYVLEDLGEPGVANTAWAPSKGCVVVRSPTAGWVKQWQVCTENRGCSAWIYPNHENATLSDYIPIGTPPSAEAPESPDITPPSVTIGGTTPGQWYAGVVPIVANAADSESPVSSITIYVNDEPIYSAAGGSTALSWDSSGYNGQIVLKASATDAAGNTGWTWMYLDVSNRPPTVSLNVPYTVSSQVWFECSAGGAGPITKQVLVDGTEIWQGDWGWDSDLVADGPHTVTCRATDIMGRVTEQSAQTYVYNDAHSLMWIYPHFQTYTAVPGDSIVEMKASLEETDLDLGELYEDGHTSTCSAARDPNVHTAMVLDCDGAGPGNRGIDIAGRPDGEVTLQMHAHAHNDYQMTTGDWWYSHTFWVDNTPPVIVVDPAATTFVDVDGVSYLHLEATTPVPVNYYAPTPDSITNVEFFVRLPDGTTQSLGAVTSGYPWTLQVRVPDNAIVDSNTIVYAVATDTVFAHVDTPVHRTGNSPDLTVIRPTTDSSH